MNRLLVLIAKKVSLLIVSVWLVVTICFLVIKTIPGNPFESNQLLSPETLKSLHFYYGLDLPILQQYIAFLKQIFSFKIRSIVYDNLILVDILKNSFPISISIGLMSLFISVITGVFVGSLPVLMPKTRPILRIIIVLFTAIPIFVTAILIQYLFACCLQIVPTTGIDSYKSLILPTISLSLLPTANIAKIISTRIAHLTKQEFVIFAFSKGLTRFEVWKNHLLKNIIPYLLSFLGPTVINLLTGVFVVEQIFGIHGIGYWVVQSTISHDYTISIGLVAVNAILVFVVINILDLINQIINVPT